MQALIRTQVNYFSVIDPNNQINSIALIKECYNELITLAMSLKVPRQFIDKKVHRHVNWRQFTDTFEDSSTTKNICET